MEPEFDGGFLDAWMWVIRIGTPILFVVLLVAQFSGKI